MPPLIAARAALIAKSLLKNKTKKFKTETSDNSPVNKTINEDIEAETCWHEGKR